MFLFHKLRFVHIEMVFPNIYTTHIIISKNETKYTDIDSQSCTSPNYFPTRSISFLFAERTHPIQQPQSAQSSIVNGVFL
uniref:Uncharacterized protein n=1 Tax=Cannabis sativa TaxID=3483 RepID=A0A803R741_CANSA